MQRRTLFLAGLSCLASLGLASCASPGASTATTTASAPPSHCGYVTSEQGVPPQDQDIFEAFITQIDGRSTGTGM
ncbi:MAG TPA: hypothetical protein VFY00_01270, partial [Arenimonas sp.]|nr:hypothetical protein [Arenimonas sp.]